MIPEETKITKVSVMEDTEGAIYSDGSRRDGHTAAATTRDSLYLRELATVMAAERLGIAMGCTSQKR